jgi:hypothetical protein
MPSAVQVQRPKEEVQVVRADLGVRIVSVESRIDSISLSKGDARGLISDQFDFDVELDESTRTHDGLSIRYSFAFGMRSSGSTCKVSGKAVLRFSQFNPGADFHTLGNDISNEMAVEIFRKNYESMYLLHIALGMDAPSPWITQEVSLSLRSHELGSGTVS